MATVPTYDSPTVAPQALAPTPQSSVVSPDMLDAGADREIAQGEGLQAAGRKISVVAVQAIRQQDLRDVQAATATLGKAQQDYHLDALQNRTGTAADGLTSDFDAWNAKQVAQISDTLTSPAQQTAFQTMAGRSALAVRASLGSFQVEQQAKAADSAFDADVKSTINNGAVALTPDAAMVQRDLLVPKIAAYSALRNMGPEATAALQTKILTEFHTQRIQQLAVTNPNDAAAYFQDNKGEIAGSQQAELGKFATQATATSLGSSTAAAVFAAMGPKNMTDPVNEFDMEQKVRTTLAGNDAAIAEGIKTLRENYSAFHDQRTEQGRKMEADASSLVLTQHLSGAALRSTPEFVALAAANPDAAARLDTYADNKVNSALIRANATDERAQQILTRNTNAAYFAYSNPDTVASMSRDEIMALLPDIGAQHTQALLTQHDAYAKSTDRLATARIDHGTFTALAVQAGMNPDAQKLPPDQKQDLEDRLARVKNAIDTQLEQEQQAKGRPLSPAERRATATATFDDTVRMPQFFGLSMTDPRVASSLSAAEQPYAVVQVPTTNGHTENVTLSSIPPAFRAQAISQLNAAGRTVTQRDIARTWVLNRKTWQKGNQ